MVEVKYRSHENRDDLKEICQETLKPWNPSWIFVASPQGFFFEPCHTVFNNDGDISPLYDKWVEKPVQDEYLKLLNEFEPEG